MKVRPAVAPDGGQDPHRRGPADTLGLARWRVPGPVLGLKFAAMVAVALLAGVAPSNPQRVVGLLVAGGLAVWAARDVLARERLAADRDGVVVVRGYARRQRLAWSEIEQVRVDERLRLGARMQALEIDTGDHLYIFSRFDLGAVPTEVREALESLRR